MYYINDSEWLEFVNESKNNGVLIERVIKSFYRRLLRRDSIVIDIGAHVGYHTLGLAEKVSDGIVIACEANPKTYLTLIKAICNSEVKGKIVPINAAIQDDDNCSNVTFHLSDTHPGRSGLEKTWHGLDYQSCSVIARTIDSIVFNADLRHVEFVKCDVEGTEFQVLRGAEKVLTKFRPIVVAEHSKKYSSDFASEWFGFFGDLHYTAVFPNGEIVTDKNFNDYWYVFLVPDSRIIEFEGLMAETMHNWRKLV
jgi:FkbM family methyltransferase